MANFTIKEAKQRAAQASTESIIRQGNQVESTKSLHLSPPASESTVANTEPVLLYIYTFTVT